MRSKLMKIAAIGLFTVAMLFNVSFYFDSNDSQDSDLSLGSLKVRLFQKAYAVEMNDNWDCWKKGCYISGSDECPGLPEECNWCDGTV